MFDPLSQAVGVKLWFCCVTAVVAVAVFFRFRRIVSVRNWDVIALFCLPPGLLLIDAGREADGFLVLFATTGYLLLRAIMDLSLQRRPACEPNLSVGGLVFLVLALSSYQAGLIFERDASPSAQRGAEGALYLLDRGRMIYDEAGANDGHRFGPGYYLWHVPTAAAANHFLGADRAGAPSPSKVVARSVAAATHLLLVAGLLVAGARVLGTGRAALALAVLYGLMPYTMRFMHMTGHLAPGMVLVWAVCAAGMPIVAGALLGLATSMTWYAALLVPLWLGFYRGRGMAVFLIGFVVVVGLAIGLVAATGGSVQTMFARTLLDGEPFADGRWNATAPADPFSFWHHHLSPSFRLPVLIVLVIFALSLFFWPSQKTVTHVAALSTAVLLAVQFWLPRAGGMYIHWYLPLLLVTLMRPGQGQNGGPSAEGAKPDGS